MEIGLLLREILPFYLRLVVLAAVTLFIDLILHLTEVESIQASHSCNRSRRMGLSLLIMPRFRREWPNDSRIRITPGIPR